MYNLNYVLPFSNHSNLNPVVISGAENFHLITNDKRRILDAQCGNICCNLGYSQNSISQSIYQASLNLPYSRYNNGMVSEAGLAYSKRLSSYFPNHKQFFFGNSGSDAIETAIRLSYIVRKKVNSNKHKIVTFKKSYHGSTWLTGSMSDVGGASQHLPSWPDNIMLSTPFGNTGEQTISELKQLDVRDVSVVLIEPFTYLSGVHQCSSTFWSELNQWCKDNDIHLILDESASGFFKVGAPFFLHRLPIDPSFVCLTKSITAGYAPLSATAIHKDVWSSLEDMWIVHGWTHNGNVVGLAAANESLNLFERIASNQHLIKDFSDWLIEEEGVSDVRLVGNFFGFDMKSRKWRRDSGVNLASVSLEKDLQLTTFKMDNTARGCIPLNANENYFEELKQKVHDVLNDNRLLRSPVVNSMVV